MKKRCFLPAILPLGIILLEALPYGAVMNFAAPNEEVIRKTYSYFSLLPYGYANFGPLLTAIFSVFLLILGIFYILKTTKALRISIAILSAIAAATSLMPLMLGLQYISTIGILITLLLLAECAAAIFLK